MTMTRLFLAYTGALLTFVALDLLWLGFVVKGYYQAQVGPLLLATPNWIAAALLYLAYAGGIVFFVILPALEAGSLARALGAGALFGLVVYGVYDLTNLATLRGWTVGVAVADILWGAAVTAAAAGAGFAVTRLAAAPS
jgi:uncharacterized membrane protein